jgi:hypothetical protein
MQANCFKLGATGLAIVCLVGLSSAQTMERGAFLRKPAESRQQLINQVRQDPIVSARYQRHFGMTHDEVIQYFSQLNTGKLQEGGRYAVWHVREEDGVPHTKWLTLRTGEPIFADADGRAVLKLNCGNPMVDRMVARRAITTDQEVAVAPPLPPIVKVAEPPAFVAQQVPVVAVVPPPAISTLEATRLGAPPALAPVEIAVVPPIPPVIAAAPAFPPAALLALPLLFAGGGGGGGAAGPPGLGSAPLPSTTYADAVPEPGTMAAFGLGAAVLALRRRRRKAQA